MRGEGGKKGRKNACVVFAPGKKRRKKVNAKLEEVEDGRKETSFPKAMHLEGMGEKIGRMQPGTRLPFLLLFFFLIPVT